LRQPAVNEYATWNTALNTYRAEQKGLQLQQREHYYHYWHVHIVYLIQDRYPVFAKHNWLLHHLKDDAVERAQWLTPHDQEKIRTFDGKAHYYDALSFYVQLYNQERRQTFAMFPAQDYYKQLNNTQAAAHRQRLADHAQFIAKRYSLQHDQLFQFLVDLLELQSDYQQDERVQLASDVEQDIVYMVRLIAGVTGQSWDQIVVLQ